ncbi:hypothetical protein ABZS71_29390 [Streptomyces sp. NPDC005393]|uniref:hypothetical protein n=1 Tax=Streptomyces sp. NPDC005393 TaxID=3157041 RepID=UPI0033A7A54E
MSWPDVGVAEAAEGLSPRAYLARLANTLLTPAERAEQARAALRQWNGYGPGKPDEADLDAELDRRLVEAAARRP